MKNKTNNDILDIASEMKDRIQAYADIKQISFDEACKLMKITIEKTAQITIDTSVERKRINKAFKDDKITRQK